MANGIEYKDALDDIAAEIYKLVEVADKNATPALKEIGGVVSTNVTRVAPVSDNDYYYSKGQKKNNVHLRDDVVFKIKKSRKTKGKYVSISGGKSTWPKWHVVNDGHVAENGKFIPGKHFVEKAMNASESQIDSVIERYLKGVAEE